MFKRESLDQGVSDSSVEAEVTFRLGPENFRAENERLENVRGVTEDALMNQRRLTEAADILSFTREGKEASIESLSAPYQVEIDGKTYEAEIGESQGRGLHLGKEELFSPDPRKKYLAKRIGLGDIETREGLDDIYGRPGGRAALSYLDSLDGIVEIDKSMKARFRDASTYKTTELTLVVKDPDTEEITIPFVVQYKPIFDESGEERNYDYMLAPITVYKDVRYKYSNREDLEGGELVPPTDEEELSRLSSLMDQITQQQDARVEQLRALEPALAERYEETEKEVEEEKARIDVEYNKNNTEIAALKAEIAPIVEKIENLRDRNQSLDWNIERLDDDSYSLHRALRFSRLELRERKEEADEAEKTEEK